MKLFKSKQERLKKKLSKCYFICNVHPFKGYHEVGCPHREWSIEQLEQSLKRKKHETLL